MLAPQPTTPILAEVVEGQQERAGEGRDVRARVNRTLRHLLCYIHRTAV